MQIEKGDYGFFINKNYKEDISGCDNSSDILTAIEQLRNPISLMSKEIKKRQLNIFKI